MYENYLSNIEKWEAQNYYMLKGDRANIPTTARQPTTTPATPREIIQTTSTPPTTTPIVKVLHFVYENNKEYSEKLRTITASKQCTRAL